jgi:hypothetical protein
MKRHLFLFTLSMISATAFNQEYDRNDSANYADIRTDEPDSSAGFDFFGSDEPVKMTLTFDVKGLIKTKSDPENFDATITLVTSENDTLTQSIKVKARGEMRRNYCSFPPIMLKFKDNKDGDEPILSNGNIKLVTHCGASSTFESYIFKEYLAYKLYNLVTPYSYRTRLAIIEYKDVNTGYSLTEYGFVIESTDQLAQRNNSTIVDNPNITQKNMDDYEMARVAFFNYMIGNTDWSVHEQHNVKVLKPLETNVDKGIPVTYDFDYSGFVSTRYSAPSAVLPIKYVTDRYYLGTCISEDILSEVIDEFEAMKTQFISTIENFNFLSNGHKKKAQAFISGFYKKYRTDNLLISDLTSTCKK